MTTFAVKLSEIAQACNAELHGDPDTIITGVASLEEAKAGQITFIEKGKYRKFLKDCPAAAIIMPTKFVDDWPGNALIVDNPRLAHARCAALFNPAPKQQPGIHPTAIIGEDCQIGPNVGIGPYAVIGDRVTIGAGTVIGSHCAIENDVVIGQDCQLFQRATIHHSVQIGHRAMIQSGAVIGTIGFGLARDGAKWVRVPQIGRVIIGDDVAVGANSIIDRGAIKDTVIKDNVQLDGQVLVAHNVQIGEHTAMAGCSGIAGSTKIGANCIIGGACAIADHITIADQVVLTGMSGVPLPIKEPGVYSSGTPAIEHSTWRKVLYRLIKIEDMYQTVQRLEKQLSEQEES